MNMRKVCGQIKKTMGVMLIGTSILWSSITVAKQPVVISTDLGFDDWMAILYTLKNPDIDVLAIGIVDTGEVYCYGGPNGNAGPRNLARLLKLAGKEDIPYACGSQTSMSPASKSAGFGPPKIGPYYSYYPAAVFPDIIRKPTTDMYKIPFKDDDPVVVKNDAAELIASTIKSSSEPVVVLSIGPMTTVANAVKNHPEIIPNIKMLYQGGGVFPDAPGEPTKGSLNIPHGIFTTPNKVGSWNIFADVKAAAYTFDKLNEYAAKSGNFNITLVPNNFVDQFEIKNDFYQTFKSKANSELAKFVVNDMACVALSQDHIVKPTETCDIYTVDKGDSVDFTGTGLHFWDPSVAYAMMNPDKINLKERNVQLKNINQPYTDIYGETVILDNIHPGVGAYYSIKIAWSPQNAEDFYQSFQNTLLGESKK